MYLKKCKIGQKILTNGVTTMKEFQDHRRQIAGDDQVFQSNDQRKIEITILNIANSEKNQTNSTNPYFI